MHSGAVRPPLTGRLPAREAAPAPHLPARLRRRRVAVQTRRLRRSYIRAVGSVTVRPHTCSLQACVAGVAMSEPEEPCLYREPQCRRDAVSAAPDVAALDAPPGCGCSRHSRVECPATCRRAGPHASRAARPRTADSPGPHRAASTLPIARDMPRLRLVRAERATPHGRGRWQSS